MSKTPDSKSPSNWAIRFLEWFCPDELVEGILGDLLEAYEVDLAQSSPEKANRQFILNVFRFFHPSIILRNHLTINFINMGILKNYIKIAFRSFAKQKLTTAINLFGLTLGITCAILAYIFVQHELSFDKFHAESENIYWVSTKFGNEMNLVSSPTAFVPQAVDDLPEITAGCRLKGQEVLVELDQSFIKERVLYTDANFFSFFNFKIAKGADNQLLKNIKGIVISEAIALKYFGSRNPIGESLTLHFNETKDDFLVAAVAKNAPDNSSIQFSFLLPMHYAYKDNLNKLTTDMKSFGMDSFIRLKKGASVDEVKTKLIAFANSKLPEKDGETSFYQFIPNAFNDFHLGFGFNRNGFIAPIDKNYVHILGVIGFLILLVACLNFMNLSNAKSSKRLTEVGVRKVLGAKPSQLSSQFLSESILISLFSFVLAIFLIEAILPYIKEITDYELKIDWFNPRILLPLLGITVTAGFLAGIFPSIILARLKAVSIFKSSLKVGGNNWATKSSLVFQFAISVGLLSCTFIMYQQQQFMKNKNLGFDDDAVVVIPTKIKHKDKIDSRSLVERYKQEVIQVAEIQKVSGVSNSFHKGNRARFFKEEDGKSNIVFEFQVDADYIPLLDISLKEGRNFSIEEGGTNNKSVIVNEAFLKLYEIDNPIGYRLPEKFEDYADATIIGVTEDYNYSHLRETVKPMLLQNLDNWHLGNILVKISPNNVENTLAQLKTSWEKVRPEKTFEFSFLDEDIQKQYLAEERWNKVIAGATLMAILISMLGLFGLIALTLAERTKEIGVRKILGASIFDITWLISRQFVLILGFAAIIAIPLALYGMQNWLENFAYQIEIQWVVFLIAVLLTAFLALLTTGIQAVKAGLSNPVEALRKV